MKKSVGGRPALYGPKGQGIRVDRITDKGVTILGKVRRVMKSISKWPGHLSDGDIVEYVLRCWHVGEVEAMKEITPKTDTKS